MPIKIDICRNVCVNKNNTKTLFKNEKTKNKQVVCAGTDIFKNSKFNPIHVITLKLLEKTNPIMERHPKIAKKILAVCEKILSRANILKGI